MNRRLLKAPAAVLFLALLFAQAVLTTAQQPSEPGSARGIQARSLNNQLLEVYSRLLNLPRGDSAETLRGQAAAIIGQRAGVLEALIRENPAEAISLAFTQDLLTDLAKAFPESAEQLESLTEWEGPLEVTVEDDANFQTARTIHRIWIQDRGAVNIHFSKKPTELTSGAWIRIRGVRVRSEIAADSGGTVASSPGAPAMCSPLGPQKSIVLLVNMPGTAPPNITTTGVHDIFFAASGRSVSEFWRENSYGKTWAEGDVKGWYTLDQNYSCDQYPAVRDAAIRAADADVDFSQYNRVFVIISGMGGGCGWAGIANVGCGSTIQSSEGNFVMSAAWMLSDSFFSRDLGVRTSIHEGGHNLGLHHAASRRFVGEPLGPPGVQGTLDEYGDVLSAMGLWNFGHYAAPQKVQLGWMTDYVSVSGNGAFGVQPVEFPSSIQALKIQRGLDASKSLWLEYRQSTGLYDSQIPSTAHSGGLIHYEDTTVVERSQLLDFAPETASFEDAPLKSAWTDPYSNLSIAIDSGNSSTLGVTVAYGSMPCVESGPTVMLSPPNPAFFPGDQADYVVTVVNNDSASCAPRTFSLSSVLPSSWPTTLVDGTILAAPGSTGSTTMKKAIPTDAVPATYPVNVVSTASGTSTTALANLTVKPVAVCVESTPIVALSPQDTLANAGENVTFAVTVTNKDSSVCPPRTFRFSSLLPGTWATTFSSDSLTIAPALTASTNMQKSIPMGTSAASYPVNGVATAGIDSAAGLASITVRPSPPSLTIALSAPTAPVKANSTVSLTATVAYGASGASRALVVFTLITPNGVLTKKVTADTNGRATWNYKIPPKGSAGDYIVSAQATYSSQTVISSATTFSVR